MYFLVHIGFGPSCFERKCLVWAGKKVDKMKEKVFQKHLQSKVFREFISAKGSHAHKHNFWKAGFRSTHNTYIRQSDTIRTIFFIVLSFCFFAFSSLCHFVTLCVQILKWQLKKGKSSEFNPRDDYSVAQKQPKTLMSAAQENGSNLIEI